MTSLRLNEDVTFRSADSYHGAGRGQSLMQEKNRFTESSPVDDKTFRLDDGNWEDWEVRISAQEAAESKPAGTNGYEQEIVDI